MSRIINPEGVGKKRKMLVRSIIVSIRELMNQDGVNDTTRDLAAFIVLALESIAETIEQTVSAWEKRDYWLKADRFHMEWIWAEQLGEKMRKAVLEEEWSLVALTAAQIAERLNNVKIPTRHGVGTPWIGAWKSLKK